MTAKRAVMLVKKVTYFGEFVYLNSSCIRKNIILLFLSSSRNKFTLLQQNSVTDVFVDFRPRCWCPCRWILAWRLHTMSINLGKTFPRISRLRKIAVTWILARVLAYLPFLFSFLRFWTLSITRFSSTLNDATLKTTIHFPWSWQDDHVFFVKRGTSLLYKPSL